MIEQEPQAPKGGRRRWLPRRTIAGGCDVVAARAIEKGGQCGKALTHGAISTPSRTMVTGTFEVTA